MKRTDRHAKAIELLTNQINNLRHEQESQFIAGEPDMVNRTQDVINQLTSSLISLNELSVAKPLRKRTIQKLRKAINKREIKEETSINFDTMWSNNQVCAIVPLRILEHLKLEL